MWRRGSGGVGLGVEGGWRGVGYGEVGIGWVVGGSGGYGNKV